MEKLRPSFTFTEERLRQLEQVVPEAFMDGKINWNILQEALGEHLEDESQEHFGLTWPGKREARRLAALPPQGALIPAPGQGINEDTTHHLFIEGENLEVLKLLQKSYAGRIKMIYIDPPYNTGNDFVYEDDYSEPLETYLKRTGQMDEAGRKLTTNTRASGRFHSKWLSMMYPRLLLARQLLREDGVIFVSIDDNEVHHLRMVMNEVFGEENFISELIWNLGTGTTAGHFTRSHEYILCYAKQKSRLPYFASSDNKPIRHGALKKISKDNPPSPILFPAGIEFEGKDGVFEGTIGNSEQQIIHGKMIFEDGKLQFPVTITAGWAMRDQIISWLQGRETFDSKGQRIVRFYFNSAGILWYEKERETQHPKTVLSNLGSTKDGSISIKELFGTSVMTFPKPIELLKFLVGLTSANNDLILDFFAGSCTTAHAVLQQNLEDGGHRQFIMVQLPEPTQPDSEAYKAGFVTIAEIGKERIRRVIRKIQQEQQGQLPDGQDQGFRVYKLARSHFVPWKPIEPTSGSFLDELFAQRVSPLTEGWTKEGLLTEILLLEGFPLDSALIPLDAFTENHVLRVHHPEVGHELFVCLDEKIRPATITRLKDGHILRAEDIFICLDSALTDEDKITLDDRLRLKVI